MSIVQAEAASVNPNWAGGWGSYHPLSENRNFSGTKHSMDLRPVSKFELVHWGPVETQTCKQEYASAGKVLLNEHILNFFESCVETDRPTDGPTDQPTDIPIPRCFVAEA